MDKLLRIEKMLVNYDVKELQMEEIMQILGNMKKLNEESQRFFDEIMFDSYLSNNRIKREIK